MVTEVAMSLVHSSSKYVFAVRLLQNEKRNRQRKPALWIVRKKGLKEGRDGQHFSKGEHRLKKVVSRKIFIISKSLSVDWDLTVSMSVFTAQQIHHATHPS